MRTPAFDGNKRWLQIRRPGENPAELPRNPFFVANAIETQLRKGSLRKELELTTENGGKSYAISTFNVELFELLKTITRLDLNTAVEVVDHPTLNKIQGVCYQADTCDLTTDEMLNELKAQGVTAVRRITRWESGKMVNTPLTVLSFSSTRLPSEVFFGWTRVQVRTYYESPMICKNCLQYRHTKKRCTNKRRCPRCANDHPIDTENPCSLPFQCPHCPQGSNEHSATGRKCPIYREEEAIIRIKTDESLTWAEARKRVVLNPTDRPSFAAAAAQGAAADIARKNTQIAELTEKVEKLTELQTVCDNLEAKFGKLKQMYARKCEE